MRRLLVLLLFALPAVALAADAKDGASASTPPTASPAKAPPPAPGPPPTPPISRADPADCRMDCAQTYYFCRAGSDEPDCSPAWSRCVATCASPDLTPSFSTTP
jgi:hypothetical protein